MNKKGLVVLVIAIIAIVAAISCFAVYNNNKKDGKNNNIQGEQVSDNETNDTNKNTVSNIENTTNTVKTNEDEKENNETTNGNNKKTLVVYYSAQSHTKSVAEKIASNLNADLFEIVPEEVYTEDDLDWTDNNSRVSREHNNESLRDVKLKNTKVNNWEDYDTVLIGYPIWWGIAAWPIDSFVKANNFDGKTVIPFCTSSSSGLGQSGSLLQKEANSGNWQDGHRFSSSPSDSDIQKWTDSIK